MINRATIGVLELSGIFYSDAFTDGTAAEVSGFSQYQPYLIKTAGSRSSAIYGASDTVMPASVNMIFGLYLGRTA